MEILKIADTLCNPTNEINIRSTIQLAASVVAMSANTAYVQSVRKLLLRFPPERAFFASVFIYLHKEQWNVVERALWRNVFTSQSANFAAQPTTSLRSGHKCSCSHFSGG